jgi:hypothetical protein
MQQDLLSSIMWHYLQANIVIIRVNLIIENLCVLHPTTHKANKVNPAGATKSGGFMYLCCRLPTLQLPCACSKGLARLCKPFGIYATVGKGIATATPTQMHVPDKERRCVT